MSMSRLWVFLGVALPVLASIVAPMSTVDLTYHLRAGEGILTTGTIPTVDTWTFTIAGQSWFDQQWGGQVVMALAERVGGWTGLVLLRAALTAVIFGCLVAIGRHRGLDPRWAGLLAVTAFVIAAPAMAMRPQLLGMACFAMVLLLVAERRQRPRLLWLVPVIVAVWANLHGSFFLGPLVVGLAWLEDLHARSPVRRLTLWVAGASAVAASLTPYGPAVWAYAVGLSSNPSVTARVAEWQATSIRDLTGLLFYGSVGLVVLLLARSGRTASWPVLAWLAVFVAIGAYAQRGVAWWPLAAVVPLAGLLAELSPTRGAPAFVGDRRLNAGLAVAIALAGLVALPAWRPVDARTGVPLGVLTEAPSGLTQALRDLAEPGDHVLAPQELGSWIEYAVPGVLVAVDSRIEIFPAETWTTYERILGGADGWERDLEAWDVRFVVGIAADDGLIRRLQAAGWRRAYDDADGVIVVRPESARVIR